MKIESIKIRNFKGIADCTEFQIKPITLFIGANSSGKSSVIHALTALSQTCKLPNSSRALILDDEHADVHLGRFIEVIHTRSYTDSIGLEFTVSGAAIPNLSEKKVKIEQGGKISVSLSFKSTIRTQDIYLYEAIYTINETEYKIIRGKKGYHFSVNGNIIGKTYRLNGFLLDERSIFESKIGKFQQDVFTVFYIQQQISERLNKIRYLGPFRQSPRRRYPSRGASPTEVGAEGESTITLLANEMVQHQTRKHNIEISKWMQLMGIGNKVEVQRLANSDLFDAGVQLIDGERFPIADLGYGISQILPVLAQCSFSKPGDILLFEQPELHLHTSSASKLATVFTDAVKKKDVNIISETHSLDFFKRFITEIREGRLEKDDFVAYKVVRENKKSCFTKLNVEDDGEIYANWEQGL